MALGVVAAGVPPETLSLQPDDPDMAFQQFVHPPDDARPWVYWYFMDGNLTREGMEADLAAMKRAGIGGAIYLEVGIGIPPGPVEFMSPSWQQLLGHAFSVADQLGLQMALAAGPGWCGAGGPWVRPDQSMQHLVFSTTHVQGPAAFNARLPQPRPRTPFFGEQTLSPELLKIYKEFYQDEFLLAFPTPAAGASIRDIDEKALYTRGSYSSQIPGPYTTRPWVRPFLPSKADLPNLPADRCIDSSKIVNLTGKLQADGTLPWNVPAGNWTILRFGRTLTGQTTRPAPKPGLGLETDKFSAAALDAHFDAYIASLLHKTGAPQHPGRGLVALHFDSWEMSSQNWSPRFRQEFTRRRGYDPVSRLPTFAGLVVDNPQLSERFLWDIRQTANELVCENQAQRLRRRGRQHGLFLSLEPYDLNPASDLGLGATADIPMAEHWSEFGHAPSTGFSLLEAVSVGHTQGRKIIGAESFTASPAERGLQHPASVKAQGDWAFCQGINKFVIHRYQAQPWLNRFPGMTMGPDGGYGVHWERTQTWWDFSLAYHTYIARCSQMLRRGLIVADILYLNPEGAPSIFFPPRSALVPGILADRRGYNFDACAAETLIARASVKAGRIVFPDGASYRLLVLPRFRTITPRTLAKLVQLVESGATLVGAPPQASPSLSNYPACDHQVRAFAEKLWPSGQPLPERRVGQGRVLYDSQAPNPQPAQPEPANPLATAQWISSAPNHAASAVNAGTLFFQRSFTIEDPQSVQTASLTITAANSYHLYVNGKYIHRSWTPARAGRVDISALLRPGSNQFLVRVQNSTEHPSASTPHNNRTTPPAERCALIASLALGLRDHTQLLINTDRRWTCSTTELGPQAPAAELGPYNMPPWNLNDTNIEQQDIYPSYAVTAEILQRMGIPSDFESDAPLRYIHRTEPGMEFYFIANGEPAPCGATCRFRVTDLQPEWWDPLTGERHDLPQFSQIGSQTEIPLHLESLQSGFVVFRKPATAASSPLAQNFPSLQTILTLNRPWVVAFDPHWGGPAKITFPQLEDWSRRPEPGIRNYSGKATYTTTFDCALPPGLRAYLSLGRVAVIASIKLNGADLGVLWCMPWRMAIPENLLRPSNNTLQITVANLWVNRLIADSGLPADQRLTWITGNPFHPQEPLLESGLLGPVTIQVGSPVQQPDPNH